VLVIVLVVLVKQTQSKFPAAMLAGIVHVNEDTEAVA
jgi:hypothetical protein